jgi:catechol 2,3-dioxygenase-like lactoylglutathione lyase family enzyme
MRRIIMKRNSHLITTAMAAVILLGLLNLSGARAADKPEFSRTTIDMGVVVKDIGKAVKFYTEAIGFSETKGFSVPADFAADAGLTYNKPLEIRVLRLGDGEEATKLKLMEVPGADSKKSDNEYIHSQLGFRYITIFVTDTNAAMARLKKAGVEPITKAPLPLPKGLPEGVFLTVVRDPDGNLVELVGPKG